MDSSNNRPPSKIVRTTLVVYAKKGAAFLYIARDIPHERGRPHEHGRPHEKGEALRVRLAPRLARLLIVLDVAWVDDALVIEDLRGYRRQSVLRAEIEELQGREIKEDTTITEYVFLVRQAIDHEVVQLPTEEQFHFDPIENEPCVGYRITPPGIDVVVLL